MTSRWFLGKTKMFGKRKNLLWVNLKCVVIVRSRNLNTSMRSYRRWILNQPFASQYSVMRHPIDRWYLAVSYDVLPLLDCVNWRWTERWLHHLHHVSALIFVWVAEKRIKRQRRQDINTTIFLEIIYPQVFWFFALFFSYFKSWFTIYVHCFLLLFQHEFATEF